MIYLKNFKLTFLVWLIFTSCSNKEDPFNQFLEFDLMKEKHNTVLIMHENFCKSCVYHMEEFISSKRKFKRYVIPFYLIEHTNQYIEPEIKNNFHIRKASTYIDLKFNSNYIYKLTVINNKVKSIDSFSSAEFYKTMNELTEIITQK